MSRQHDAPSSSTRRPTRTAQPPSSKRSSRLDTPVVPYSPPDAAHGRQRRYRPSAPTLPDLGLVVLLAGTHPKHEEIVTALADRGVSVEAAVQPFLEAIAADASPDLVVLAGELARDDGRIALEALASSPSTVAIPVAVLSENDSLDARLRCFRSGACALVPASSYPGDIADEIATIARMAGLQHESFRGCLGRTTLEDLVAVIGRELASRLAVSPDPNRDLELVLGDGQSVDHAIHEVAMRLAEQVVTVEPSGRVQQIEFEARLPVPSVPDAVPMDPIALMATRASVRTVAHTELSSEAPCPRGPDGAMPAAELRESTSYPPVSRERRPRFLRRRVWLAAAAAFGCVASLAIFASGGKSVGPAPPEPPAAAPRPTQTTEEVVPALADRATAGDLAAIAKLEARPPMERSAAESLALVRGRRALARAELQRLQQRARDDTAFASTRSTIQTLRAYAADPALAPDAMQVIALLPTRKSADVLFELWAGTPERSERTRLAEALLYSPEVSSKASQALRIALDLRRAATCEDARGLLARAQQHADKRSLVPLAKMLKRRGCGNRGTADCFPCMRRSTELSDAVAAALRREAPHW